MTADPPGYVLHEPIGEGAHATVWRAEPQGRPGRVVAVKRLRGPVDQGAVRALRREAEALERLSHPSILQLLDVVEDGDGVALVVPYAPGGSLAARIAARLSLPPAEVADVGARVANALAAAHDAGLLHRDVKPANILFDAEGQPLLADFGTAQLLGGDRAAVAGTAEYLDPDVLRAPGGTPADVYGLGATLYEMLAGVPPYAGSTPRATLHAADRGHHLRLTELVDAPRELADTVEAAIARDPAARPATAARLAAQLDEACRGLHHADGVPPPPPAGGGPAQRDTSHGQDAALPPPSSGPARSGGPAAGAAERSGTRLFGPAPPPAAAATPRRRAGLDRRLLIAAAMVVVAVPAGLAWWLAVDHGDADAPTIGAGAPVTAESVRTPAPRCEDVLPPPDLEEAEDTEVHDADVAGRGCSVPVMWDGELLLVPRPDELPAHYDLDAEEEDVLLFGDWTCDGHDTPALYRPPTGELFVFDGFADEDEEVTGRVEDSRVTDGAPRALTDEAGCDRIEVGPA